jgi:hypothetical protein
MEKYLGVKIIHAVPMDGYEFIRSTKGEEELEKVKQDSKFHLNRSGYKVVYEDGEVSWFPKGVFDKAYRRIDNLTFGLAVEALKLGKKVTRKGWNGKELFFTADCFPDFEGGIKDLFYTSKKESGDNFALPWNPLQEDIFAEDWQIIEEPDTGTENGIPADCSDNDNGEGEKQE